MATVQTASKVGGDVISIDEVIEQIGVGRFQWRLLLVNGLTWAADAMEVLMIGFLIGPVIANFQVSPEQVALIGSVTFAGMFLGAWLWGQAEDRIGRRRVFMCTVLQTAVFRNLAAF